MTTEAPAGPRQPLRRFRHALAGNWRQLGTLLVLAASTAFFLWFTNRFYPVEHWLFFRYAGYWALSALFLAACGAAGHAALDLLMRRRFPLREHAVFAFALGVLIFVTGWFVLGVLALFNPWTAVAWPLVLSAAGAPSSFKWLRRVRRKLRAAPRTRERHGPLYFAALAFGVLALGLVYLPLITPANLAFDSRFYHMAIAEHYASDGAIRMFPEGWFMGAYPQLASHLYSWAFTLPLALTFDKAELSVHLEFVLFLYTLASIPTLVRALVPGVSLPLAWVAVFLFPELFCYDSLLSGAADHIAAIWCVPIFLATFRVLERFSWRRGALLGLMLSGAMLTKYSVWAMVFVPCGAVTVRGVVLGVRRLRGAEEIGKSWLTTPLVVAGVVLLATAPHWLKNLIWHHDPLYPLLHAYFPSRPWTPDNELRFHTFIPKEWVAERSWKGVRDSLLAAVDFSFVPRDWWGFHRDVPIFGSLFTFSVPCLIFVRRRKRLLLLYLAAHLAVVQWYWSFHQDRYLQSYVPWMAAGIAAVGVQLWRLGLAARLGVAVVTLTQVVWGADVPFFPTHNMVGGSPHKVSIDFLSTGHRFDFQARFRPFGVWHDMADALPPKSKIVLHDEHIHLGIGVPTVSDFGAWQGGISYGRSPAPEQVDALLRGMGVTHLVWPTKQSKAHDSLAADIAFFNFVTRYAEGSKAHGPYSLARMPSRPPTPGHFNDLALVLGCNDYYENGVYRVTDLSVQPFPFPGPKTGFPKPREPVNDLRERLEVVDAVVTNGRCFKDERRVMNAGFVEGARRNELRIWVRRGKGRLTSQHAR